MITRININGFKSLLNTELYLGPFTCVAGANATGKSNLFDALAFLACLADNTILQAAKSVRSEDQRHSDVRDIFFRSGVRQLDNICFEVDMIVPLQAEDDLGQVAQATITSLRYILKLKLNDDSSERERIEIVEESLLPLTQTATKQQLYFPKKSVWTKSVLLGRRASTPFISTDRDKIKLHQDGNKGRASEFVAQKMPRTLLSTATAESPTAFLARHEMRNWMMLQFEPSALRQPSSVHEVKNARVSANGLNLPATLYRLHRQFPDRDVYQSLTNSLKLLVEDVDELLVEQDEKRDLLTLQIRFRDGLILPAHALSDGTLRFVALALIAQDSTMSSVLCLEEPENGISPAKIGEMIALLEKMATDTNEAVDTDNPLRQVIVNSHSPLVVKKVSDESLYLIRTQENYLAALETKVRHTALAALPSTWKTQQAGAALIGMGEILAYLGDSLVQAESVSGYDVPKFPSPGSRVSRTTRENLEQQFEMSFDPQ